MNDSQLIGKILITGRLCLKSPLLIGDGAGETSTNFRDVHVLRAGDVPFIPGTSLCGVLRDWLEGVEPSAVKKIFGDAKDMQSSIQLDDILLTDAKIIQRDGVRIDGLTSVVDGDGKYDYEAIERGGRGDLRLLINLRGCHAVEEVSSVVARMTSKLAEGIRLGALTTKGFGLVAADDLRASFYDFRDGADVAAWLLNRPATKTIQPMSGDAALNENDFVVDAEFSFRSSFIVRDYDVGGADADKNISAVTLKSRKDFVIPGTSLKGVMRHRAEYICARLGLDKSFLTGLMGSVDKIKSRLIVAESYVAPNNFSEVEHTRTKLDRFTGGTLQGTLFTTKPAYQKKSVVPSFKVHFEIRQAKDFEAGLAMFLLRDLWLGRVAIGGEKSIGRGAVKGLSAVIKFKGKTYKLGDGGKVISGDRLELESFAAALKNFSSGGGGK